MSAVQVSDGINGCDEKILRDFYQVEIDAKRACSDYGYTAPASRFGSGNPVESALPLPVAVVQLRHGARLIHRGDSG